MGISCSKGAGIGQNISHQYPGPAIDAEICPYPVYPRPAAGRLAGNHDLQPEKNLWSRKGRIFTNFVLADEINHYPRQGAVGAARSHAGTADYHQRPHLQTQTLLVMATQNPIEQEGTYRLPEAQVDRFMLKGAQLSEERGRETYHSVEPAKAVPQSGSGGQTLKTFIACPRSGERGLYGRENPEIYCRYRICHPRA